MRDEYVDVRVPGWCHGASPEDGAVRHERYADAGVADLFGLVLDVEAVGRDGVDEVRVLERGGRRAQARRLVVSCGDEVGDVLPREAGGLLEEADDHVRRGPHRVEDVAGVDHQVHVPLQDGVHRPPVGLLDVHLPLVAARLGVELRVAGVPEVRIRDVGYAYYGSCDPSRCLSLRYSSWIGR